MLKKMDLGYIGFSELIIKNILESRYYNLVSVICPVNRIHDGIISLCKNSVQLYTISEKKELIELFEKINVETYLIYKFPIIIPSKLCLNYNIFNIHPGDLRLNRGAHPIVWSILNGCSSTKISLYKLKTGIDLGELIAENNVEITNEDDSITLENKLEKEIPRLIEILYSFLTEPDSHKTVEIDTGIYLRKVNESDFTINMESDSIQQISRKIRSQRKYNGAIVYVGDKKYYVNDFQCLKDSSTISFTNAENNERINITR